jgi:hypothetical protein
LSEDGQLVGPEGAIITEKLKHCLWIFVFVEPIASLPIISSLQLEVLLTDR